MSLSRTSFVTVPVVAAALGIAGVLVSPAQAASASMGGLTVTPAATLTSWSGSTVGSLHATDASTRGDVSVLGIPGDTSSCAAGTAGAAQILRRSGNRWVPEQRLEHPKPLPRKEQPLACDGSFGRSVSTDGTRVAVLARFASTDFKARMGAVYVYGRDADTWQPTTVLAPDALDVTAVSISGDRLAVAGHALDEAKGDQIVTYTRGADGWAQDGVIEGAGAPMALDGDSLAYSTAQGRVAIADRTDTGWLVRTLVRAQSVAGNPVFATASMSDGVAPARVLLTAGTLTVAETVTSGTVGTDRVEFYARGIGGWVPDGEIGDPGHPVTPSSFGTGALSRDGDTVVVGATDDPAARPYGAAYVFARGSGGWSPQRTVAPSTPAESDFGDEVAVAGDALGVVAGAVNTNWGDVLSYDVSSGARTSAVNGGATGASHRLGWQADVDRGVAAALTQEHTLVGDTLARGAGALYVYGRGPSGWARQDKVTSPGAAQGLRPTLRGPVVVAGGDVYAVGRTTAGRDTLLRFIRSGTEWVFADQLPAPDAGFPLITDVAIATDQLVLSASADDARRDNRTYVFQGTGGRWTDTGQTLAAAGAGEVHVALTTNGKVLALAARDNIGVTVYERTDAKWQATGTLALSAAPVLPLPAFDADGHLAVVDAFGAAGVAFFAPDATSPGRLTPDGIGPATAGTLSGGVAGVGEGFVVSRTDPAGITHLEVLERSDSGWDRTGEIPGGTRKPFDDFGTLVAADATTLLVGAPGTNSTAGREAGQVHLYALGGSDTTPPTVTGSPDRAPDVTVDGTGWWTGPVTVSWKATDDGSGLSDPVPAPTTVSADGRTTATSAKACDRAGNCATGSYPLQIDGHGPVVTIGGVDDGRTYTLGSVPTATCSATDEITGVDGTCTVTVSGGNANRVGAFTVRATATDRAGNPGTASATYEVHYPWKGFDQPINDTAQDPSASTSVFKAGSTVPVKFTLRDAAGRILTPATVPAWVTPIKGSSTSLPIGEAEFTDAPDAGTAYQLRDGHWQYNWKTDRTQAGSYWRIGVRLDDGSVHYVTIAHR